MEENDANLLSRYQIDAPGLLEAWSIRGRFGLLFVAVSLAVASPVVYLAANGQRPEGFWFLLAFAGFVFLAGLAIMSVRATLRVSAAGIDYDTANWRESHQWHAPRAALSEVTLAAVVVRSGKSMKTVFRVSLLVKAEDRSRDFSIFRSGAEPPARRAAQEVARSLHLPLVDAIGDRRQVTNPDELHRPRPERFEFEGSRPETVEQDFAADGRSIVIRGTLHRGMVSKLKAVGIGFLLLSCGVGFFASQAVKPPLIGWLIPFPFWGAGLYFLSNALTRARIRERIRVQHDSLIRELEFLGRTWRRQRIARSTVQTLRIQTRSADKRGVAVVTADGRLMVGAGLEDSDLPWLRAWISQQIA